MRCLGRFFAGECWFIRKTPLSFSLFSLDFYVFIPITISWDMASTAPNGFFSWILISPASVRRQSLSSRRLWFGSFTILTPPPSLISIPSLNQLTTRDSWGGKGILKAAFWPTLTITGLENLWRSSWSNAGMSIKHKALVSWYCSFFFFVICYMFLNNTFYLQRWPFLVCSVPLMQIGKLQSFHLYSFELSNCEKFLLWLCLYQHLCSTESQMKKQK